MRSFSEGAAPVGFGDAFGEVEPATPALFSHPADAAAVPIVMVIASAPAGPQVLPDCQRGSGPQPGTFRGGMPRPRVGRRAGAAE
jgi:hypothetical protein